MSHHEFLRKLYAAGLISDPFMRSNMTTYYVSSSQTTTDEPGCGWYVEDAERHELRGPFGSKEAAEQAVGIVHRYNYDEEDIGR